MHPPTPETPAGHAPNDARRGIAVIAVVLLVLDYCAGPSMNFPVFYVFPVMLAAWRLDFRAAALLGIGLTLARFVFQWLEDFAPQGDWARAAINNAMRAAALILVAWLTEITARQNRLLRERVKKLESMLPLCPTCDTVRDQDGRWRTLDEHAAMHAKTRQPCPACAEKEERL
jgi:hypothetical protein